MPVSPQPVPSFSAVGGIDWTLDTPPPLQRPPLSLLQLAPSLLEVDDLVAEQQQAQEKVASAQRDLSVLERPMDAGDDMDVVARNLATEDARSRLAAGEEWESDVAKRLADLQRWEQGLVYLPELSQVDSMEIFVPGSDSTKETGSNQPPFLWCDPFVVVGRDDRSLFGWPRASFEERTERARRAQQAHEAWMVEEEFWTGAGIPTNYHLSASQATAVSSPHRTITAWPDPAAAPGTVLGTAVGTSHGLAALDQAIADADAGVGMIHCTPFLLESWAATQPIIRAADGRAYTSNGNLFVPGYGYPGTGPDVASRTVTDGVLNSTTTITSATGAFSGVDLGSTVTDEDGEIPAGAYIVSVTDAHTAVLSAAATASESGATLTIGAGQARITGNRFQWAYATEMQYTLAGALHVYPWDFRQGSPDVPVDNAAEVRAERSWGIVSNQLLRAAVLVDTQTA